jgi:transcriptional regulator with PAS, ATPase and Fis domain
MHIYYFNIEKPKSGLIKKDDWIKDCYKRFKKSDIKELFIIRRHNLVEVFAVGLDLEIIIKSLIDYISQKFNSLLHNSDNPLIDHEALRYFFALLIGKNDGLPADPRTMVQIHEEFNLALDEGAVGSILTRMYRQGEQIGNDLQNDPVINKNFIAYPEVLLDISKKISGDLEKFQFIFIGTRILEIQEIINAIKRIENQKCYLYDADFSKAYRSGIELGCIPINKSQFENQLDENTIIIDFEKSGDRKLNWIIPAAKKNKGLLYIYFDLSRRKQASTPTSSPNLYVQSHTQIISLIDVHIRKRKAYLQTIESVLEDEIKNFYTWLYSDDRFVYNKIVSADRRMQKVFELLRRIAPSDINVLITGETGTGKELIARAIHQNSLRSESRFVAVNCSAIPDTLLEGELFGYEKGAFTGAISAKKGLIEIASGGTLFLDEIGDLPPVIQVKLLRVLQEREILQIGNTTPVKVDIRLVTATNHNLDELTHQGKFRSDLFYRVNTVQINLPALRERRDDIPILTKYFIKRLNRNNGKQINKISDDVYKRFVAYDWPGNIRELENIIERAFAVSIGEEITLVDLPTRLQSHPVRSYSTKKESVRSDSTLKELEVERINDLLINKNIKLSEAAKILGIGRTTLWRKMRELGISRDQIDGNF